MKSILFLLICIVFSINIFAQEISIEAYKNESGKWGFSDKKSKKEVVACIYDSISFDYYAVFYLKKKDKWGAAGLDGKEMIPCIYDQVYVAISANYAIVTKNGKSGVINLKGNVIVPIQYDEVADHSTSGMVHFLVIKDGKTGLYNPEGQQRLPLIYDKIDLFYEQDVDSSVYFILLKDGKKGVADKFGELVIKTEYDEFKCYYHQGYIIAKKGKWGVLSPLGHDIIACEYDTVIVPFQSWGMKVIYLFNGKIDKKEKRQERYEGKFCVANIKGEILADHKYDYIYNVSSVPPTQVECNGKVGMIDKHGVEVIPCKYDWVTPLGKEGLFKYLIGTKTYNKEKKAYIDKYAYDFDGKYGLLKADGEEITGAEFSDIELIERRYVLVKGSNGKSGIYNESGKMVIPCKFDEITNYHVNFFRHPDDLGQNWWRVFNGTFDENNQRQGKFGLYDRSGKALTKVEYDDVSPIKSGGYMVKNNGKWAVLSKEGKLLTEYKYDAIDIRGFQDGRLMVFQGEKLRNKIEETDEFKGLFGYIDETGKEVISLKYTEANTFYYGKADVVLKGRNIEIDVNGKEVK